MQVPTQHPGALVWKGPTLAFLPSSPARSTSLAGDLKDGRRRSHPRLEPYQDPSQKESYSLKGTPDAKDRTDICNYHRMFAMKKEKENTAKIYIFISRDE